MAQQANITAFDGASTPISHTLVGEGISRDADGALRASWKESLIGEPDYAQIRVTSTKKKLKNGVWLVEERVEVPIKESVSGVNSSGYTAPPKVAHTPTVIVRGLFHERSTAAERRLVRQLALNIAGNISTTVTPVTTGPVPELMDQLLQVS